MGVGHQFEFAWVLNPKLVQQRGQGPIHECRICHVPGEGLQFPAAAPASVDIDVLVAVGEPSNAH